MARDCEFVDVPEIFDIYTEVVAHARELGYLEGVETPPLYWLKNSMKTFGKCQWTQFKTYKRTYYNNSGYDATITKIMINVGFRKASAEAIRTILVHEVTHACAVAKYGPKWGGGHNNYFYAIGRKLGLKWSIDVKRLANKDTRNEFYQYLVSQKGMKMYDKIYRVACGKKYCRTWIHHDRPVDPRYVDTGIPYRNQYFYSTHEAAMAKRKELADRGW